MGRSIPEDYPRAIHRALFRYQYLAVRAKRLDRGTVRVRGRAQPLLGHNIPENNLVTARCQNLPIRTEDQATHNVGVAGQGRAKPLSGRYVPEDDSLVPGAKCQQPPVRAKRRARHVADVGVQDNLEPGA